MTNKTKLVVGIAGGTGSGKSTLARRLSEALGDRAVLLHLDDYYKKQSDIPPKERTGMNYDHPAAFDTGLLLLHLDALKRGEAIDSPVYDFSLYDRTDEVRRVAPAEIVIVEGVLLLSMEEVQKKLDLTVYVDADADIRLIRRIRRDVKKRGRSLDSVIAQYLSTVKPMHDAFVEPSKRFADLLIPEGGKTDEGLSAVLTEIEKRIV